MPEMIIVLDLCTTNWLICGSTQIYAQASCKSGRGPLEQEQSPRPYLSGERCLVIVDEHGVLLLGACWCMRVPFCLLHQKLPHRMRQVHLRAQREPCALCTDPSCC